MNYFATIKKCNNLVSPINSFLSFFSSGNNKYKDGELHYVYIVTSINPSWQKSQKKQSVGLFLTIWYCILSAEKRTPSDCFLVIFPTGMSIAKQDCQ